MLGVTMDDTELFICPNVTAGMMVRLERTRRGWRQVDLAEAAAAATGGAAGAVGEGLTAAVGAGAVAVGAGCAAGRAWVSDPPQATAMTAKEIPTVNTNDRLVNVIGMFLSDNARRLRWA